MSDTIPHSERLLVVVGPSGAGKDTVMAAWQHAAAQAGHAMYIAQRVITRPARAGGEAHEALDPAQWQAACAAGEFVLHWHAHGLAYGVRARAFAALETGTVLLNGSRAALHAIRARAPHCRVVQITASAQVLAHRLQARGREDAQAMAERLRRGPAVQADISVTNDGALADTVAALMRWWETALHVI